MKGLQWDHKIFNVKSGDFASLALEIFRYQAAGNKVYRSYLDALNIDPGNVFSLQQVPYLPIRFFKSHEIVTGSFEPALVFESSGTSGSTPSRHLVKDPALYEESFLGTFTRFYGAPGDWAILGLLPSYLERKHSSLVHMVNKLIELSANPASGFYLDEFEKLSAVLQKQEKEGKKTLLIGVSFALLDLAEKFPARLKHTTIMETGGMKGRREELIRAELHKRLQDAFAVNEIHSEYGMTELLSQAYSQSAGIFHSPPWMKIVLRDEEDPFTLHVAGETLKPQSGAINVIDLANVHSCSFIATDDIGKLYPDESFEVLGRMDGSDLRGCSLMVV